MDIIKFEKEFNWVIKVLESCEKDEQVLISRNLFDILMNRWSAHLSKERIISFSSLFSKLEKHQLNSIGKKMLDYMTI